MVVLKRLLLFTPDPQTLQMTPKGQGIYKDYKIDLSPEPGVTYDAVFCYEKVERPAEVKFRRGCSIFMPGEPSGIKSFSTDFINQFEYLLTFRKDLTHRFNGRRVDITNCLTPWRIGLDENLERGGGMRFIRSYDKIKEYIPHKEYNISMIVSNKTGTPLQRTRIKFAQTCSQYISGDQLQIFGRGVRDIQDKAIALDNFKFSICMENTEEENYFTEKIVDCILTDTIPLYWGCPNISNYFDITKNSLFILDPYDLQKSIQKLAFILQNSETIYQSHKEILLKDKEKILDKYMIIPRMVDYMKVVDAGYNSIFHEALEIESKVFGSDVCGYWS